MLSFNISILLFTVVIILTAVYFKIYRIATVVGINYVILTGILFFSSKTEKKTVQNVENIESNKTHVTPDGIDTTVSITDTIVNLLHSNEYMIASTQLLEREITFGDTVQYNAIDTSSNQIVEDNITEFLEIRNIKICREINVEQRKPIDVDTIFTINGMGALFCFTGMRNTNSNIQTISHIWEYHGRVKAKIEMEVSPSPFWRCWSRKRITENHKGNWRVKILNHEGDLIGEKSFIVN